jgi:thiol-disulfide isomerase/thioredoxin
MFHKKIILLKFLSLLLIFLVSATKAQTISGNLAEMPNEKIALEGFNGLSTYAISNGLTDAKGNFKLKYAPNDFGVGYLKSSDNKSFVVILCGEDVLLEGLSLNNPESLSFKKGQENKWFEQYAKEQPRRDQALSAWDYLEKIYAQDTLFKNESSAILAIATEKKRINTADQLFLDQLPGNSYVKWYLPLRKLIRSTPMIAQYKITEIEPTIQSFREMDLSDNRLYKSGLYKELMESHFWLIENSGKPLDSVFEQANRSIDTVLKSLRKNTQKYNEGVSYLFDLMEQRSFFKSAEYLALKALNESEAVLNVNLVKRLEFYRAMKKGAIAPDIKFNGSLVKNGKDLKGPYNLSDIKDPYTLVVFGASWCQACSEEIAKLMPLYTKWKKKGIEVVFISLDTDREAFKNYTSVMPFYAACDYKKWETQAVKDYLVYASPTFFLLNQKREILLKPTSVDQMDVFIDYNMK